MIYSAVRSRGRHTGLAAALLTITTLALLALPGTAAAAATLGLSATNAPIGQSIKATAELSDGENPTGTITFEAFSSVDTTCSGSPALISVVSVNGNGSYVSASITPDTIGTYRWSAHYSGDLENPAADVICAASSSVTKAAPTLTGSASSTVIGGAIKDEATLAGAFSPTGEVTFKVFGPGDPTCAAAALATDTAPIVGGKAAADNFTPASPGEYRWTASYPGDDNNAAVETPCGTTGQSSTVSKASPALTGSASSTVIGGVIKDEATLTGALSPTGEVTFKVFGPGDLTCATALATDTAPIVAGKATADDFVPPSPGEYRWTASYPGDSNNAAVETPCGTAGQSSTVSKATPLLAGTATSTVKVGLTITDTVVVSAGVVPSGELIFRAFGPGDATCANPPAYEKGVPLAGDGSYAPEGFAPPPGLYIWTVTYAGDANNAPASIPCGTVGQESAVGTLNVTLAASATGNTVGSALTATATLGNGATPGGQLTFKAFPPSNTTCSGAAAFSSTVTVKGNGTYNSGAFTPSLVGTYRWTVAYSGDANHAAASAGCGAASSAVAKANPTIAGKVGQKLTVGTSFRDTATLSGGFSPGGTITFEIYLPGSDRCDKPDFVNTVAVNGNGTYGSDPFVAKQAGRYRFIARYSGDASNQVATEACGAPDQLAQVGKRTPKLRPRAKLTGPQQISIRASLAGASSPAGVVSFRLFSPGDRRCTGRPAFSGSLRVKKNGSFTLAEYIATKPGVYRLAVAYSGDPRNAKTKLSCAGTQAITIRG